MELKVLPVRTARDMDEFVHFPWQINRGDPHWVAPLLGERRARLDVERNLFWHSAERELWIARRGNYPLGTIAAFHPRSELSRTEGSFGFFDCVNDLDAARCLLSAAENWLMERGAARIRGPYNPGENDEAGILVTGFETRPAIMEGHNPPYYDSFFNPMGYQVHNELVARMFHIPAGVNSVDLILPERLRRVAERAGTRKDLRVRSLDSRRWEAEIHLAWEIFNAALAGVPDVLPVPWAEFRQSAEGFRPILQPDLALIAEVGGKSAGFALALPDISEALQPLDGKLGPLNLARLWWGSRRLRRVSFKILMILPEFQGRGVEAVLIREVARAILKHGFREVDLSLTGENNEKSQRFQKNLGLETYRRYRIYEKGLDP